MPTLAKVGIGVVATLVILAIGAGVFIGSGAYNIGADDHHTKTVLALIELLRDRSIGVRARALDVPALEDAQRIEAGAAHYAEYCVGCHLAPGVRKSELRAGLYPHPPNLAEEEPHDARQTFWTIKHGIKMSAMPAWGKSLDDAAIWDLVSFVRKLPTLTPETYRQLSGADEQPRRDRG
jgi:mono/diheme cytochrome c family protein